jgi:hypothetical protein
MEPNITRKDLIPLMMSDVTDLTDDNFLVKEASDDGGSHIEIQLEEHSDSSKVRKFMDKNYPAHRIIIMNVPQGYLND